MCRRRHGCFITFAQHFLCLPIWMCAIFIRDEGMKICRQSGRKHGPSIRSTSPPRVQVPVRAAHRHSPLGPRGSAHVTCALLWGPRGGKNKHERASRANNAPAWASLQIYSAHKQFCEPVSRSLAIVQARIYRPTAESACDQLVRYEFFPFFASRKQAIIVERAKISLSPGTFSFRRRRRDSRARPTISSWPSLFKMRSLAADPILIQLIELSAGTWAQAQAGARLNDDDCGRVGVRLHLHDSLPSALIELAAVVAAPTSA